MIYSSFATLAFLSLSSFANCIHFKGAEANADFVTALPGQPADSPINTYSGLLTVDEATGKKIHYWLVLSESSDPMNDPVVFWTNGGPGCSGLIGMYTEQGPYFAQADGSLNVNDYRWNKISNMVFVEQPSGVGFSYSDTKSDYNTGDPQAADDNYNLVVAFLTRFPEYQANELYLSGESYGGHYLPQWSSAIIKGNAAGNNFNINFKGFLVANPFAQRYSEYPAMIETLVGHQLVAKPTYDKWDNLCNGPESKYDNAQECEVLLMSMTTQIGNLNPYALDFPVCVSAQQVWMNDYMLSLKELQGEDGSEWNSLFSAIPPKNEYEPCQSDYTVEYLNREDVKEAIHVNSTGIMWKECSSILQYSPAFRLEPMNRYYRDLLQESDDMRILIFSGDDDSVCGTSGTQRWVYNLGYEVDSLWDVWTVNDQVAGYMTSFVTEGASANRMRFATVHSAGHEVPAYKPHEAYALFEAFLKDDYSSL